jgi:hypothetical protein
MMLAAVGGVGAWPTVKLAAVLLVGRDVAWSPEFDPLAVVLGGAIELAVAVVWGMVFALLFRGLTRAGTVVAGIAFGFVMWGVADVAFPALFPAATAPIPMTASLVQQMLAGLALGVGFAPFQAPMRLFLPSPWDIDRASRRGSE